MHGFWITLWKHFKKRPLNLVGLLTVVAFGIVGLYAPFLASSKPLIAYYEGEFYFPLFRYLFYPGFYTKRLDLFFNILMFTFPLGVLALLFLGKRRLLLLASLILLVLAQAFFFFQLIFNPPKDPEKDLHLIALRREAVDRPSLPSWDFDLHTMTSYGKLNVLLRERQRQREQLRLKKYAPEIEEEERKREKEQELNEAQVLAQAAPTSVDYKRLVAKRKYEEDRKSWLRSAEANLAFVGMPLLRPYHWEDDANGSQRLNQAVPWWEITRINRKDLVGALIFGIRISLVVGLVSVAIALALAIPIGSYAGYYGGTFDIFVSRWLEIWESMPTFFMLLLVVAITQSKSIFLVILVIGLFGWTGFSRFLRGEFFKQRNLPYVDACRAIGYHDSRIIFSHILPNAVPPLLTLLPFAIMGAITSEAGLSFLGLGEEGSSSWGVLMDEGRGAFPGETYLLWPPAILLTILLIAIAIVGDGLRDALDPKS